MKRKEKEEDYINQQLKSKVVLIKMMTMIWDCLIMIE